MTSYVKHNTTWVSLNTLYVQSFVHKYTFFI